jgi:hypothetical protein
MYAQKPTLDITYKTNAWLVFINTTFPDDYEGSPLKPDLDKKQAATSDQVRLRSITLIIISKW